MAGRVLGAAESIPTLDGLNVTGDSQLGSTVTSRVAFFGATVTIQPTTSNEAAAISTAAVSQAGTIHGYATSTQANQIVTLVNQLRADLVALGLIKGS